MPVLSMISSGTPEVEINLPAAEYIRRDQFDNYHCTFDIYPGETYPLKLISVTPKANANQLYTMRLQVVPGTPAVPSPGMNTMVTISYRTEQTNTLSVPTGAILTKRRQSVCIRLQPIGQHSAQTGNIHATFTEQRTQPHHCRTAETGRADCILGSTSHRGWRNCKTFTTCH